jgi:hypothetical protein
MQAGLPTDPSPTVDFIVGDLHHLRDHSRRLHSRRRRLQLRDFGRTTRVPARRCRRARGRLRRPRRAPPGRDDRIRPQHLGRCERGHGGRHPANTKVRKLGPNRSKRRGYGGAIAYLRVENPRFLFLGGSADVVAAAAPPVVSTVDAGASAAHVASLVGCLAADAPAPAPGVVPSTASAALGEGGEGYHLSGGAQPPSLYSSSSDDEYSEVPGEESPCCSRNRNSSLLCSRRSRRRILLSFLCAAHSCSRRCAARVLELGTWAGRTAQRSRPSPAGGE